MTATASGEERPYAARVSQVPHRLAVVLNDVTTTLVERHDADAVLRLVTTACTDLLGATATGVMLVDPRGGIRVVSASDEHARFVELLQAHTEQGPCVESIHTGGVVNSPDLAAETERWPEFVPAAMRAGFRSIHAIPMRLDGRTVGGVNLLHTSTWTLSRSDEMLARVLADLATLGLAQERDLRRADRLAEQTLQSLNDRVELAQAVGMVAGSLNVDPDRARAVLVERARQDRTTLRGVARAVTTGALTPAELAPQDQDPRSSRGEDMGRSTS